MDLLCNHTFKHGITYHINFKQMNKWKYFTAHLSWAYYVTSETTSLSRTFISRPFSSAYRSNSSICNFHAFLPIYFRWISGSTTFEAPMPLPTDLIVAIYLYGFITRLLHVLATMGQDKDEKLVIINQAYYRNPNRIQCQSSSTLCPYISFT